MSFHWLGSFRQGSWQAFRKFILEERRDSAERIRVIQAELVRIGNVTVMFTSNADGDVTEKRDGFSVTPGSSLGKLIQAYVAQGGNPFDISLFLTPDHTVILDSTGDDQEGTETQPYNGSIAPKTGSYNTGEAYEGGYVNIKKYAPARTGGRKQQQNARVAGRVAAGRNWVNPEIRNKRDAIEQRILKLCDLREQFLKELTDITMAIAGVLPTIPGIDEDQYDKNLSVSQIVAAIDSIFYEMDETNTPDFTSENGEALGRYPFLLSDDPEESDTAL